jgi:ubiquinol-cytochrome c reductase cytochrome b subunit
LLIAPVLGIGGLVALPFYAAEGEKSWHKRPIAIIMLTTIAITWGVFTHLGTFTPWSPKMNAWSGGPPVPVRYTHAASPLQRQGAIVFQSNQCRNCHSIAGVGGQRGPALDLVATRMTEDQLIRQVLQGGGNMPAYGKNLSPSETTALVQFLETLHPVNQPPAADASRNAAMAVTAPTP